VRLALDRRIEPGPEREWLFEERVALCAAVLWKLSERSSRIALVSDEIKLEAEPGGATVDAMLHYLATVEPVGPDGPGPPKGDQATPQHLFDT
jgi:hypothetical protein